MAEGPSRVQIRSGSPVFADIRRVFESPAGRSLRRIIGWAYIGLVLSSMCVMVAGGVIEPIAGHSRCARPVQTPAAGSETAEMANASARAPADQIACLNHGTLETLWHTCLTIRALYPSFASPETRLRMLRTSLSLFRRPGTRHALKRLSAMRLGRSVPSAVGPARCNRRVQGVEFRGGLLCRMAGEEPARGLQVGGPG